MARLLQNSSNPGKTTASWGGIFDCCLSKPRSNSPATLTESSENKTLAFNQSAKQSSAKQSNKPKLSTSTTPVKDPIRTPSISADSGYRPESTRAPSKGDIGARTAEESEALYQNWVSNQGPGSEDKIPLWVVAAGKKDDAVASISGSRRGSQESNQAGSLKGSKELNKAGPSGSRRGSRESNQTSHLERPEFQEEEYNKDNQWKLQEGGAAATVAPLAPKEVNCALNTFIRFEFKTSKLSVEVKDVTNAPTKETGGAQYYQLRVAIVGAVKKHWASKIVAAPEPQFNEQFTFSNVAADEVTKSAMRFRLYACDKVHRLFVFAESTIAFTSINLQQGANYLIVMQPRVGKANVHLSGDESDDSRASGSVFGTASSSGGSIRSKLSKVSGKLHLRSSMHSSASSSKKSAFKTNAEAVASAGSANWPELQVGLSYNETTKRLGIRVLKAHRLKAPESHLGHPKSYVSVTMVNKTGEEMESTKTKAAKMEPTTEFGEEFAFSIKVVDAHEVALIFRVKNKHKIHKSVVVGWFAMGCNNTGEEEKSHWNEMLKSHGQEIIRWHALHE